MGGQKGLGAAAAGESAAELAMLRRNGITHILNCTDGAGDGFVNRFPGRFEYLDLNLDDREPDPSSSIETSVAFAAATRAAGGRLLVHCQRGVNRSGTMAMACVMEWPRRDGSLRTLQEAYASVMGGRPAVRAGGGPRPAFLDALCQFEKRLRGGDRATLDMGRVKEDKVMALKEGLTREAAKQALDSSGGDVDRAAMSLWCESAGE